MTAAGFGMNAVVVRLASPLDAPAAVELLRASITESCVADHQNDAATLGHWLSNKTVEHFTRWVTDPENHLVAAEREGALAGVGLVRSTGEIHLCYVRPGLLRSGVGSAILPRLEDAARSFGLRHLRLTSTLVARPFYERHGYLSDGEPTLAFGVLRAYPYLKRL